MKKAYKALPAFIFVIFIFAMLILFLVLPKSKYSSSEKRYLSDMPKFSSSTLFSGEFGEKFETYLSDHTAFRNFYVGLNAYYNLALGNNGSCGIYNCKNNYLVNDPCEYDRLSTNLDVIKEFAENTDIDTTVLIAPSTGYICSDILPKNHLTYNDDKLFELINKKLSSTHFADIRNAFKSEYENGNQIYYKTDHHWTSYGAFVAYKELSDYLGYTANEKAIYDITSYDDFYGTTYSSSGFWLTPADKIEVWDNKSNDSYITTTITDGANTIEQDDMFFYDHLTEDDKYPVFIDGNHPLTVIKNTNADSDKNLLIIKDSFAHSLTPFLADHYSTITLVDMRYYKDKVSKLIEDNNYDQILFLYSIDNLSTDTDLVWLE